MWIFSANIWAVGEKWSTSVLLNQKYRGLSVIIIKMMEYYNSMVQNPSWEANRSSASQEIPYILWNPKVH
jgi:hypothetical protein